MMEQHGNSDVAVVGGGLAGLAAATYLARAGRTVTLFERARDLGGRAQTQTSHDYQFNLGPHAVYRAGAGAGVLRELGVTFRGGAPPTDAFVLHDSRLHAFPATPWALLTTGLLGPRDKLVTARAFATLRCADPAALAPLTVREWLERTVPAPIARRLLEMALRVATYAHDPERLSAGAAVAQLQRVLQAGVLYLDGGWQTLVDGLRQAAEAAGVRLVTSARVAAIVRDRAVRGVRLANGATWSAPTVLVAASPTVAAALVETGPATVLRRWADTVIPVRAASLTVALRHLPNPRIRVAFGLERPLYLSVHSAVARLAPPGGALVHVARYLGDGRALDPGAVERELVGLLDRTQPGWREALVARRYLPHLTVANALPTAAQGGTAGRPGPAVPDVPGLYVAGDWVGPEGLLADASLASARQAARLILATERSATPAAPTRAARLAASA